MLEEVLLLLVVGEVVILDEFVKFDIFVDEICVKVWFEVFFIIFGLLVML